MMIMRDKEGEERETLSLFGGKERVKKLKRKVGRL